MEELLKKYVDQDWIGVEMARRKVVFHAGEQWDKINLWGLFNYRDIKKHLKKGDLINHLNYTPKNKMYWVTPSKEYWINFIKPITQIFSEKELQESF